MITTRSLNDAGLRRGCVILVQDRRKSCPPWPEGAAIQAAMKADDMLDEGDLDGAAVWRQIVAAINDLQRVEPKPGERRH